MPAEKFSDELRLHLDHFPITPRRFSVGRGIHFAFARATVTRAVAEDLLTSWPVCRHPIDAIRKQVI